MVTVNRRVGRLIELRSVAPLTVEEIAGVGAGMFKVMSEISGPVAACVDMRGATVVPPEISTKYVELLRRDNPRVERSAFVIVPDTATLAMQVERIVREAGNPNRRVFRSAALAHAWLSEVLSDEERERLGAFLAGG